MELYNPPPIKDTRWREAKTREQGRYVYKVDQINLNVRSLATPNVGFVFF